jgi:hypothetical protein
VRLKAGSPAPQGISVAIHRSKADGTYTPATASIGVPTVVPGTGLTTSYQQIPVYLSGVAVNDPSRQDYCLVIKGTNANVGWVEGLNHSSAPANGTYQLWTTDSGSSWSPMAKDRQKYDTKFNVWGYFSSTSEQTVTVDKYFLSSVRLVLRVGADAATRMETSVQVLNEPEVTGL